MRTTTSLLIAIAALISNQNNMVTGLSTVTKSSRIRKQPSTQLLRFPLLASSTVEKEQISLPGSSPENSHNLSPFLQEMVDEQRELQMNVGKAMDTLRKDYPYFLKRAPGKFLFVVRWCKCNAHSLLLKTSCQLTNFQFQ